MTEEPKLKQDTPDWLKEIQENSWNLELLISGGAIFTLLQFPELFNDFIFSLKMTSRIPGTGMFVILGMFCIKLLTLGFIIHLCLRSYWLSLVCINYVHSRGVLKEKIKWKKPFKANVKEGDNLYSTIINVDNWCGIIMYLSIISVALILGIIFSIVVVLTLPATFLESPDIIITPMTLILLVYLFDLLFFGVLRNIPYLSYIIYIPFKIYDYLTFRFLYQKSLWMFNTNIFKLKFIFLYGFIILVSLFFTYNEIYRIMHWPNIFDSRAYRWSMAPEENKWSYSFYRDQLEKEGLKASGASIQSDIISEKYLQVYIPYNVDFDYYALENKLATISESVLLSIDDSLYPVQWYNARHNHNDQIGLRANINIEHLSSDVHSLKIQNKYESELSQTIPFWKE